MSLNKVMLIGNVGNEPEVKYVEQGVAVGSFTFATTERGYTLQNGTQVPERTEWHNIVVWKRQAEYVEKYVHKGDKLFLEGQLRTRSWDDRNGVKRYVTEIWVNNIEFLSSPRSAQQSSQDSASPQAESEESTVAPF